MLKLSLTRRLIWCLFCMQIAKPPCAKPCQRLFRWMMHSPNLVVLAFFNGCFLLEQVLLKWQLHFKSSYLRSSLLNLTGFVEMKAWYAILQNQLDFMTNITKIDVICHGLSGLILMTLRPLLYIYIFININVIYIYKINMIDEIINAYFCMISERCYKLLRCINNFFCCRLDFWDAQTGNVSPHHCQKPICSKSIF